MKRNFARRRLKALFREFSDQLNDGTFIFVAKKDILDLDFSKLRSDFRQALKRVGALDAKKASS